MGLENITAKATGPMASARASDLSPSQNNASRLNIEQQSSISQKASIVPIRHPDDKVDLGAYNTGIYQGVDRPAEIGTGNPDGGAIYLVAGQSARFSQLTPTLEDGSTGAANRNFNLDNSFIYISSECDIDDYLGVADGDMGASKGDAAIAIKTSDLRLIARNGIKIVTGTDSTTSKGPGKRSVNGVELIAGNDTTAGLLQPMVKGDNLAKALNEMTAVLDQTLSMIQLFAFFQNAYNLELAPHKHHDMLSIAAGQIAQNNPFAIREGQTEFNFKVLQQGIRCGTGILEKVYAGVKKQRINLSSIKYQYYNIDTAHASGRRSDIRSEFHKVN